MLTAKTLDQLIAVMGINQKDESITCVICTREQMLQATAMVQKKRDVELVEVYDLTITATSRTVIRKEK